MTEALSDLFYYYYFVVFSLSHRLVEYLDHIYALKALEERHLYKLSCLCEPPVWKRKSFFVLSKDRQDNL